MKAFGTVALVGWLGTAVATFAQAGTDNLLELHVKNVIYLHATQSPVVILVDKDEKRFLPIWIGFNEAQAIAMEMSKIRPPRPLTHDLVRNLMAELEANVDNVVITETKANTYYANLCVTSHGKSKKIDCRPSDGIAIALRVKAPIFAAVSVMDNAMPVPEDDAESVDAHRVKSLGITVQAVTPSLAEAFQLGKARGVLVSDSQRSEIQRGDLILAVGEAKVETVTQFKDAVEKLSGRKEIELKLLRNGKTSTVRVRAAASDK